MNRRVSFTVAHFTALLMAAAAAAVPSIGYVDPAGGLSGSEVVVTIGGQYIESFEAVFLNDQILASEQIGFQRIYDRPAANRVRRQKELVEAALDVETVDRRRQQLRRALEQIEHELEMVRQGRQAMRQNPDAAARQQFNPQIAERIRLRFRIPESVEPGEMDLRVITAGGVSNPIRFQIGQIGETMSQDLPRSEAGIALLPPLPVLVNGRVMPGEEKRYRFEAKAGQTMILRADARALIPYLADAVPGWFQAVLTLYDSHGREIAYNDSYGAGPDPLLIFDVPQDGFYEVAIRDAIHRGREDFIYRLSIGELPLITSVYPPGGTIGEPTEIKLTGVNLPSGKPTLTPSKESGLAATSSVQITSEGLLSNRYPFRLSPLASIEAASDNDCISRAQELLGEVAVNGSLGIPGKAAWFSFKGKRGQRVRIETVARRLGSPVDSRLTLFNNSGEELAVSDDEVDPLQGLMTHHADSRIEIEIPDNGMYFILLEDVLGGGGDAHVYRLEFSQSQPDFALRVVPSSLRLRRGGVAPVTVHAVRSGGFDGPISLSLVNPVSGFSLERAEIPEGSDSVQMLLTACEQADEGLIRIDVEGKADLDEGVIRRRAVPAEDRMQAFLYRHLVPSAQMMVQVVEPLPLQVRVSLPSDGALPVRAGEQVRIPAECVWQSDSTRRGVRINVSNPPEWIMLAETSLRAGDGEILLDVGTDAKPGETATLLLGGRVNIPLDRQHPDFNPALRRLNNRFFDFVIDVIPVVVIN